MAILESSIKEEAKSQVFSCEFSEYVYNRKPTGRLLLFKFASYK